MNEIWKDVVGYEGVYKVSSMGNVRRVGANVNLRHVSVNGYLRVNLSVAGKAVQHYVHRLVACAFIDNPNGKPHVNHISGVRHDSSLENLEWVTCSENKAHAIKIGLCNHLHVTGEDGANSKLTEKEVADIRETRSTTGLSYKKIADKYGVTWRTIHKIVKYETWKHVL